MPPFTTRPGEGIRHTLLRDRLQERKTSVGYTQIESCRRSMSWRSSRIAGFCLFCISLTPSALSRFSMSRSIASNCSGCWRLFSSEVTLLTSCLTGRLRGFYADLHSPRSGLSWLALLSLITLWLWYFMPPIGQIAGGHGIGKVLLRDDIYAVLVLMFVLLVKEEK